MKYNSFVNPFIPCKTDIIIFNIIMYLHIYITMQLLVIKKYVTLRKHGKNGLAILHGNFSSYTIESILNSNFFVNPFSSDMYRPVIHTL